MPMHLVGYGKSDVGRQRDNNEDSLLIDPDLSLYLVADGVGGGAAGEIASGMVTALLHAKVAEAMNELKRRGIHAEAKTRDTIMNALRPAFSGASEQIYTRGRNELSCRGMASTGTLLQVVGSTGIVGHVGDSRLYMVRGDQIYQITEDHTLFQQLLNRGGLTPEDAKNFPHKNVLSRSVGTQPHVEIDLLLVDVVPGDKFVLCSDGLTDLIMPPEILHTTLNLSPREAVSRLIERANEEGGLDNITVIIVEASGELPTTRRLRTEQKVNYLKEVFLFKELTFPETVRVLRVVREIQAKHGDVIIREGDTGDELFILVEGQVDVSQGTVHLTTIEPGSHFGELGLIGDGIRSATVTARGECVLLGIRRKDFFDLVNGDHNLAVRLMWGFLRNLGGRMKSLSADVTRMKLGL